MACAEAVLPTIPCQPADSSDDGVSKWVWVVAGVGLCIPLVLVVAIVLSPKETPTASTEPVPPVAAASHTPELVLQDVPDPRGASERPNAGVVAESLKPASEKFAEHGPAPWDTKSSERLDVHSRPSVSAKEASGKSPPAAEPPPLDEAANDRDLALLQGSWRARKVYWGPGNIEAAAIDGGRISISGKEFRKQELDRNGKLVDFVATITRVDATKQPKELDLLVESGGKNGETLHLVYVVGDASFEFFRPPAGELPPKNPWYFGRSGPFHFEDKGNLYQYTRAR